MYAVIIIYAATLRPKWFESNWLRPRWLSEQGTRTGRLAGAASASLLFCFGLWLFDGAVDILPMSTLVYLTLGSLGFLLVAAVREFVHSFNRRRKGLNSRDWLTMLIPLPGFVALAIAFIDSHHPAVQWCVAHWWQLMAVCFLVFYATRFWLWASAKDQA